MLPNYVPYFLWLFMVRRAYSQTDVLSCFEKTPDHALIGYAQDTGNNKVASLEDCLQQCTDSVKMFQFECKSALFYPDLRECNLNTATKADDAFSFVATAVGEKVDYYEKTCGVVRPGTTTQPSVSSQSPTTGGTSNRCFQQYAGKSINGVPNNRVQGTTGVAQCQQECVDASTKYQITCKSILWSEQQKACILVEVTAGDVPNQVVDDAQVDYYEYLCGSNSVTTTALPVSSPGFSPTPTITQRPQPPTGTGLRDPRISSCFQELPVQSSMTEDRIFPVTSVDQCADTCLFCADCIFGQRCNMVAYAISSGYCALSRTIGQPSGLNELGSAGGGSILYYARGNC